MNNSIPTLSIFLLFLFSQSCTQSTTNTVDISGVWLLEFEESKSIEFTPDGYYYDSKLNNKNKENLSIGFRGLDKKVKQMNYGKLKYEFEYQDKEKVMVRIYGDKNQEDWRRKLYLLNDGENSLIECVMKGGAAIKDHIQVGQRYYRQGAQRSVRQSTDSLQLIIPEHFSKDHVYVAFNQNVKKSKSLQVNFDMEGAARVSFAGPMKIILDGQVSTYQKRAGNNKLIYTYQANDWKKLLLSLDDTLVSFRSVPIPLDSTILFASSRFNPSRDFVNDFFGEEIIGNVASFNYSTIRRELGFLGYTSLDYLKLRVEE